MTNKKLTFISVQGHGLSKNLHLIRSHLSNSKEYSFEYYLNNFKKARKNELSQQNIEDHIDESAIKYKYNETIIPVEQMKKDRNKFAKDAETIICCDGSLPIIKNFFNDSKRIMIAEPDNNMFKHICAYENNERIESKKTYINFTDVICYSDFFKEALQNYFPLDNGKYHDDLAIPFANSVNNPTECEIIRSEFEEVYPKIKGKKVISILTAGRKINGKSTNFFDIDIKAFADAIPDDCIVLTNNPFIAEKCSDLPSEYINKILLISYKNVLYSNLLYFSEMFITDSPNYTCIFASKNKPFYIVDYNNTNFTGYINQFFPELLISDINDIPDLINNGKLTDIHNEFKNKFAPSLNDDKSIQKLFDIIKG